MKKLMKVYSLFLMIGLLAGSGYAGGGDTTAVPVNDYVKFSVGLKEKSLKAGATGNILIRLEPKKGIHINLKPAIGIAIDSTDTIRAVMTPTIPRADSFMNTAKPIVQPVTFASGLKPGLVTLRGIVTYYYCSDAEGWCSRFKQPFALPVRITK